MHISILSVVSILAVLPDLALALAQWTGKTEDPCEYGLMFGKGVKKAVRCTLGSQSTYHCGDGTLENEGGGLLRLEAGSEDLTVRVSCAGKLHDIHCKTVGAPHKYGYVRGFQVDGCTASNIDQVLRIYEL